MGTLGSPGRRKYACSEWTRPRSTVRPAAMSACAATCPPNTRWRCSSGLTPAEDVDLDGLDVEELDQEVEGVAHRPSWQGRPGGEAGGCPAGADRYRVGRATLTFPDGFLWGTATAAHQIEGGNVNNDWWAFEHAPGTPCASSPSGDACDSWHRWPEDLDLVAGLGLGAYRFSLEWSRIEPAEGEWSRAALDHYRRMCAGCHERGLVPDRHVPPLHDAALAGGARRLGGAPTPRSASPGSASGRWPALGDLVGWACTLNEPNIVAADGVPPRGVPPGRARPGPARRGERGAVPGPPCWRSRPCGAGPGTSRSGLTLSMADFQAVDGGEERAGADAPGRTEDVFLEATGGRRLRRGADLQPRSGWGPTGRSGPSRACP